MRDAADDLWSRRRPEDGEVGLLVAEMVRGNRELIAGLVRDPQLGPCVMLGLGGILTEALGDVVFASAPIDATDARRMVRSLVTSHLLTEPFRGDPPVDEAALAQTLIGLGRLAVQRPDVVSVDINPLIVRGDTPLAVDALVVVDPNAADDTLRVAPPPERPGLLERFAPLFQPRGIVVAGASSHPGKFGFVALHNLHRFGYQGEIFPINRDGTDVLGHPTYRDVSQIPEGKADLVFVCTPNQVNIELLHACAKKGVRAAFVASAGYGEAGDEGRARERELARTADELGIVLAGPNGQGVISTPRSMCAQIVAPYPPPGRISVVSQSGNLVSSFLNYAVETGIGISKAISCGNQAQTSLADFLEYFGADPETEVALAYLEGLADGARFIDVVRELTAKKPLVLVKGGVAAEGKRAAASHTGSLASDDRVFDGICRQLGVLRAPTVEDAFEWAATLATQPLPRGRRTVVFTTAGGWGVLAADRLRTGWSRARAAARRRSSQDRLTRTRTLESQQPDRSRWRRNARHDSRGDGHHLWSSGRRCDRPPWHRDPGGVGQHDEDRFVLPRLRPRAHRRVPRAPGPSLCTGGARVLRAPWQTDPVGDGTGTHRCDRREPGTGRHSRGGSRVLRERAPEPSARCARWSTTRSSGQNVRADSGVSAGAERDCVPGGGSTRVPPGGPLPRSSVRRSGRAKAAPPDRMRP